jgi:hypothetical protein
MGGLADLARSGRPERVKPTLKGRILSEAVRPPVTLGRFFHELIDSGPRLQAESSLPKPHRKTAD